MMLVGRYCKSREAQPEQVRIKFMLLRSSQMWESAFAVKLFTRGRTYWCLKLYVGVFDDRCP